MDDTESARTPPGTLGLFRKVLRNILAASGALLVGYLGSTLRGVWTWLRKPLNASSGGPGNES